MTERKRDPYHRRAKKEGYRSRAAYKLKQLNERFGFFKNAKYVLDLGAAPGGWLQVASEAVGKDGIVVGVDLNKITPLNAENVRILIGDVTKKEILNSIQKNFDSELDVVLSDLSPNITGNWDLDQYKQIELAKIALMISKKMLKKNGWFIVKVFQGIELEPYLDDVKKNFEEVKIVKPKASRKGSAEVYLIAKGSK